MIIIHQVEIERRKVEFDFLLINFVHAIFWDLDLKSVKFAFDFLAS